MNLNEEQIKVFEKKGNFKISSSEHLRSVSRMTGTGYKNDIFKLVTDKGNYRGTLYRNNYQDGEFNDNYYIVKFNIEEEQQKQYKHRQYIAYEAIKKEGFENCIKVGEKYYHELIACGRSRRVEAIEKILGCHAELFDLSSMGQMATKNLAWFLAEERDD